MYNSKTQTNLYTNSNSKITNRYIALKTNNNLAQSSTSSRPFSRKPLNQIQQIFSFQSNRSQNQCQSSICQKSILDTQSVVSGGNSLKQSKFVRTNKLGFLSPKSKVKRLDQSFSPEAAYGTQSMISRVQTKGFKNYLNDSVIQKEQIRSQNSAQQNQNYMQKSISTTNLYKRNGKTRNLILSKFSQLAKKSQRSKQQKKKLQTSLYGQCLQRQKQQKKRLQKQDKIKQQQIRVQKQKINRLQKLNSQLKDRNIELQKKYQQIQNQNHLIQVELQQLKKKINKFNIAQNSNKTLSNSQSSYLNTYKKTNYNQNPTQTSSNSNINNKNNSNLNNKNTIKPQTKPLTPAQCKQCKQKQLSNKKQVNYFQNIIRKNKLQIDVLKKNQQALTTKKHQIQQNLAQTKSKLNQLLQNQKISAENQIKFQQCVNQLKNQVIRLHDQLRYLKIQNTVLLKIKNQNLKLKIDITKIQDERDYFKMKVIEINKKNHSYPNNKRLSESSINGSKKALDSKISTKRLQNYLNQQEDRKESVSRRQSINKKNWNIGASKKFYLDSTETEQTDEGTKKQISSNKYLNSAYNQKLTRKQQLNFKNSKSQISKTRNYSDQKYSTNNQLLFDLTSEESQNSC